VGGEGKRRSINGARRRELEAQVSRGSCVPWISAEVHAALKSPPRMVPVRRA
jgi:hypothetical protein